MGFILSVISGMFLSGLLYAIMWLLYYTMSEHIQQALFYHISLGWIDELLLSYNDKAVWVIVLHVVISIVAGLAIYATSDDNY